MTFAGFERIASDRDLFNWLEREDRLRTQKTGNVQVAVQKIFENLLNSEKSKRESILEELVQKFDLPRSLEVSLFHKPRNVPLPTVLKSALDKSIARVRHFHERQLSAVTTGWSAKVRNGNLQFEWKIPINENPGSGFEGQTLSSIKKVGIYIPGGRASYPSSVIMNVVPAIIAGVKDIVIATPCSQNGGVDPTVEYVAYALGVKGILLAGGAHGILGLFLGLEGKFEGVDVIAGPGNSYVNEAKKQLWGQVGLDGMAGPSEIAVVVDKSSNLDFAVSDLISQLEHAPDNVGRLYGLGKESLEPFIDVLDARLPLEGRGEILKNSLKDFSYVVQFEGTDEENRQWAARAIDQFAPEHLAIHVELAEEFSWKINNAGSISIGPYAAQSFGDYSAGPSHTLPTGKAARFGDPVNVLTFMKLTSVTFPQESGVQELAEIASELALVEGFPGHKRCADLRIEQK